MASRTGPNLPLLTTVVLWAYNFTAIKLVYAEVSAPAVTLSRSVLVWFVFAAICLFLREPIRYPQGTVFRFLLQGFLANGIYMVLFMEGMRHTTPANASIIMAMSPVLTNLFSILAGQEHFRWRVVWGTVVALSGVVMAEMAHGVPTGGTLMGNLMILAAASVWAFAVVVMQSVMGSMNPYRALTLALPGALLALIPYGWTATLRQDWTHLSSSVWVNYVHVVALSGGLAFATYYMGMRQIGPGRATLYQFLIPPLAAVLAWVVLGQPVLPAQWAGLGLAILGVWYGSRKENGRAEV